jgi:hypothetical protein
MGYGKALCSATPSSKIFGVKVLLFASQCVANFKLEGLQLQLLAGIHARIAAEIAKTLALRPKVSTPLE